VPTAIFSDGVRALLEEGAQLVDVLPREEYEDEHLPKAINIPLKELDRETTAKLKRDAPVIVYCHDYQRDMSPRAAWRLEDLGFEKVYDYVPGKVDWFASGLPKEGRLASLPTIGDSARRDVPTCAPAEKVENAWNRVGGGLGRLRGREQGAGRARAAAGEGDLDGSRGDGRAGDALRSHHVPAGRTGREDGRAHARARGTHRPGDDPGRQAGWPVVPGRCRAPSRRAALNRAAETSDRMLQYNQPA
jgi:rhodanese-related sulfurtransferase